MGGYHYWKGGAEPAHPVWGYPFPGAGPPDLQHAIQTLRHLLVIAEVEALSGYPLENDPVNAAVKTAIVGLEELQATRDRLADLEGEYELTKARFNDFAEEAFERNRQHVVQVEDMDRVVSLANTERDEARDRLADLEVLRRLLQDVVDKATPFGELDEPGGPYVAHYLLPTGPIHRALAFLRDGAIPAALDGPAAQEEGG